MWKSSNPRKNINCKKHGRVGGCAGADTAWWVVCSGEDSCGDRGWVGVRSLVILRKSMGWAWLSVVRGPGHRRCTKKSKWYYWRSVTTRKGPPPGMEGVTPYQRAMTPHHRGSQQAGIFKSQNWELAAVSTRGHPINSNSSDPGIDTIK